jgi:hypothetical protein
MEKDQGSGISHADGFPHWFILLHIQDLRIADLIVCLLHHPQYVIVVVVQKEDCSIVLHSKGNMRPYIQREDQVDWFFV